MASHSSAPTRTSTSRKRNHSDNSQDVQDLARLDQDLPHLDQDPTRLNNRRSEGSNNPRILNRDLRDSINYSNQSACSKKSLVRGSLGELST